MKSSLEFLQNTLSEAGPELKAERGHSGHVALIDSEVAEIKGQGGKPALNRIELIQRATGICTTSTMKTKS